MNTASSKWPTLAGTELAPASPISRLVDRESPIVRRDRRSLERSGYGENPRDPQHHPLMGTCRSGPRVGVTSAATLDERTTYAMAKGLCDGGVCGRVPFVHHRTLIESP
ncbi:hypothetical protein C2E23DRAFT_243058 [Lenzites betulinus]|nr:hypothetical protein C2E23DRAFT_243058 [Lenzites betulinus]